MHPVTCPSCFQEFLVPLPGLAEVPALLDYDCEVCCRPMELWFERDGDEVVATARGLGDL